MFGIDDAIIGGLVSGGLGLLGSSMTNDANSANAAAANAMSQKQFETRYQTTVKDMQAAGLNPMLAYGQGGGSPPVAQQPPPQQNKIASAVEGYTKSIDRAIMNQQLVNLQKQGELTDAQKAKTVSETYATDYNNILTQMFGEDTRRQELMNLRLHPDVTASQIALNQAHTGSLQAGIDQIIQNIRTGKAMEAQHYASIDQLKALTSNLKLDAAEKQAMAQMWKDVGEGGAAAKTFLPVLQMLKSILGK